MPYQQILRALRRQVNHCKTYTSDQSQFVISHESQAHILKGIA